MVFSSFIYIVDLQYNVGAIKEKDGEANDCSAIAALGSKDHMGNRLLPHT